MARCRSWAGVRKLAALSSVCVVATSGCSYRFVGLKSEPEPSSIKASATLPVKAHCSSTTSVFAVIDGAESDWGGAQYEDASTKRIQALLRESHLFETDHGGDGEVSVEFSARMQSPINTAATHLRIVGSIFLIGIPFDFLYLCDDSQPFAMEATLECRAPGGEVLSDYRTTASFVFEKQVFTGPPEAQRDAFTQLAKLCEKILVGKLVADQEKLASEIARQAKAREEKLVAADVDKALAAAAP